MTTGEWLQWLTTCKENGTIGPISGRPQAERDAEYEKAWQLAINLHEAEKGSVTA
jgi:hypothetical protein